MRNECFRNRFRRMGGRCEKRLVQTKSGQAATVGQRAEHVIGKVSRDIANGTGVGMAGKKRAFAVGGHIPEAGIG